MSDLLRGRRTFAVVAVLLALPILAAIAAPRPEPPFHPHFPKTLECRVSKELTLTVRYQTVTFDAEGAKKLEVGKAWHLAGASLETSAELAIGGRQVPAGKWALSARKAAADRWELVLHEGGGFSTKIDDKAHVLATTFTADAPRFEHLNIDVQPGGDKTATRLYLDVRFDTLLARAEIELKK
jgi:hypothetical protein